MYCMHVCAVCSSVWVLQCGVCFSVALLSPLNFLWFVLAIRIMVLFRMIMARSRSRLRLRARPHHRPAEASHSNWWRPIRLALPQHRTVCSSWFLGFEATEGQYSSSCNMLQYHQTLSYNLNFYMFYRSTSLVLHRINIWYLICTYMDKKNKWDLQTEFLFGYISTIWNLLPQFGLHPPNTQSLHSFLPLSVATLDPASVHLWLENLHRHMLVILGN